MAPVLGDVAVVWQCAGACGALGLACIQVKSAQVCVAGHCRKLSSPRGLGAPKASLGPKATPTSPTTPQTKSGSSGLRVWWGLRAARLVPWSGVVVTQAWPVVLARCQWTGLRAGSACRTEPSTRGPLESGVYASGWSVQIRDKGRRRRRRQFGKPRDFNDLEVTCKCLKLVCPESGHFSGTCGSGKLRPQACPQNSRPALDPRAPDNTPSNRKNPKCPFPAYQVVRDAHRPTGSSDLPV
ncbi:hypothetical protein SAMN04487766_11652 [Actinomyces ruminicola]|uniref:Uncharacterized protein n=1 Tax=Actinomyces ruminicola TaxID=332524 RepID=A0A1G9ZB95_9ACTO|nr:hypothetical protein SAMN04487766_11652 [Actinomyces ruminicola]